MKNTLNREQSGTLKEFYQSMCDGTGVPNASILSAFQGALSRATNTTNNQSDYIKQSNADALLRYNAAANTFTSASINALNALSEYCQDTGDDLSGVVDVEDNDIAKVFVKFFTSKFNIEMQDLSSGSTLVGYNDGQPVHLAWTVTMHDLVNMDVVMLIYSGDVASVGQYTLVSWTADPDVTVVTNMRVRNMQYLLTDDLLDDLALAAFSSEATTSTFIQLLSNINTYGSSSISDIRSVVQNCNTEGMKYFLALLPNGGTIGNVNLRSLILKVIGDNAGTDNADGTFTPYEKPGYIRDIFQVAFNILSMTIPALLTLVMTAFSRVLGVFAAVLFSAIQAIATYVDQINAKIVKVSDIPTLNFPFSQPVPVTLPEAFSVEVDRLISDQGAAFLLSTGKSAASSGSNQYSVSPVVYAIFSDGQGGYMCQVIPVLNVKGSGINPGYGFTASVISVADGAVRMNTTVTNAITPVDLRLTHASSYPVMYDYLNLSDEALRANILFSVLAWLRDDIGATIHALGDPDINVRANAVVQAETGYPAINDLRYYTNDPLITNADGSNQPYLRIRYLFGLSAVLNNALSVYGNLNWDDTEQVLSEIYRVSNDDVVDHVLNTVITNETYTFIDGSSVYSPSIQLPTIGLGTVIAAALTAAFVGTVATLSFVAGRRALQSVATAKLGKAEAAFEKTRSAYQQNPGNRQARAAFAKANRKLNRAWRFAGKVGLSSYNGFSCDNTTTNYDGKPLIDYTNDLCTLSLLYTSVTGEDF